MKIADIRWRIARLVSPYPVMVDPFPGKSVLIHREGIVGVFLPIKTLELTLTNELRPRQYGPQDFDPAAYQHHGRSGTFSGTIG